MTREEAIKYIRFCMCEGRLVGNTKPIIDERWQAGIMAIQALSQEPCQLLIIKSDILLHQDDTKKWMDNIKRGKEDGVIILPPYFEPLLVPADIEINIEQEPCDDAISRKDAEQMFRNIRSHLKLQDYKSAEEFNTRDLMLLNAEQMIHALPSVTQKSGKWIKVKSGDKDFPESIVCSRCNNENSHLDFNENAEPIGKVFVTSKYCPNCGAKMESEV